ncbi:hypothetical protein M9H77_36328 [Catharanthus roseus]|uniref:Uncharacterized protein n=1 Tax=Catharanthus roseus TaxID=4058 RepID=A0ACB9ZSA7_CATRO|nr:hypothetical protein M9H77_36328 [Catharanthus roseus]
MRLITHNMIKLFLLGEFTNESPMGIEVEKMEVRKVGFNPYFLKKMFDWVNYNALVEASKIMGYAELPDVADPSMLESEEFLRKFHHALLELHLEEGSLVCPETGRKYPVNKGIPELRPYYDEV